MFLYLLGTVAHAATINNCGGAHAPIASYNNTCNAGNCSIAGTTLLCDASGAGGAAVMTAVEDYDGASTTGNDGLSGGDNTDTLYGGNGDDDVCGGDGTGDSINGGPISGGLTGNNSDTIWAPTTAVSPTGSVVGNQAVCGHTGWGSSWAGNSCGVAPCCTYLLTSRPGGCP